MKTKFIFLHNLRRPVSHYGTICAVSYRVHVSVEETEYDMIPKNLNIYLNKNKIQWSVLVLRSH